MKDNRRLKYLIIGLVIGFILIVAISIAAIFIANENDKNKEGAIYISNLDSCSANMKKPIEDSMRTNMYETIKMANDYNKKETLPRYESVIRDKSCNQKTLQVESTDGQISIQETTAILDIPEAKQSWKITYNWVPEGKPSNTDLGTIVMPTCLEKDKLIYGDFNCEKVVSLQKYGTDKVDPILEYVPYEGRGFTIDYDPETKTVNATIIVRESDKDNQELKENLRGQVIYWFEYRNLDIAAYTVNYTYQVDPSTIIFD